MTTKIQGNKTEKFKNEHSWNTEFKINLTPCFSWNEHKSQASAKETLNFLSLSFTAQWLQL